MQTSTYQGELLSHQPPTPCSNRIQCDEAKPNCQNCEKSQRICLDANAVKQTNFSIHIENDFASGKSKRPRGPRSVLSIPHLQDDLKTRALTFYLNTHTQPLADYPGAPGCLSGSVSFWKLSGRSSRMVDLGLSAVALVVYSRTHQQPAAAEEGDRTYFRLLQIMQSRIGDLSNIEDFDAWLLTIRLMGRYEGANHGPTDVESAELFNQLRNWAHHDGAQVILKLWNENPRRGTATYIINQARRGLIRTSFLRGIPLLCWMLDGSRFGEKDLDLHYDRVEVQLANLRYATTILEQDDSPEPAKIDDLNKQAEKLDQALQDWILQIPSKQSYKVHSVQDEDPRSRTHFYSPIVCSFSKPEYAAAWLQYFSTRMLIISTRLRIFSSQQNHLNDTYKKQKQDCNAILKIMAESLASTVPFVLGRFNIEDPSQAPILVSEKEEIKPCHAMMVIWPLSVASGLKGMDKKQQL